MRDGGSSSRIRRHPGRVLLAVLGALISAPAPAQRDDPPAPDGTLTVVSGDNLFAKSLDQVARTDTRADRWPHILPQATTTLVPSWYNWVNSGPSGKPGGQGLTFVSAILECPDGVTAVPLTVSGQTSWVLPSNGNDLQNDPVPAGACGLDQSPAGAVIWTKTVVSAKNAGVPASSVNTLDVVGSQSLAYVSANTAIDNALTAGPFTVTGAAAAKRTYGLRPIILGTLVTPTKVVAVFGDSITELTNDSQRKSIWGRAWFQRAMEIDGYPSMSFATSGSTSLLGLRNPNILAYLRYANRGVVLYCTNDFGQKGTGLTASACAANLQQRVAQMNAAGIAIVGAGKLLPRANSIDNYRTEANQTPYPGWGPGEDADQLNGMLSAMFTYTIGFSAPRGANPFVWVANGQPFYATADSTHPKSFLHAAMAVDAANAIANETSTGVPPPPPPDTGGQ